MMDFSVTYLELVLGWPQPLALDSALFSGRVGVEWGADRDMST